jgi:hypothetical protein
MICLIVVYVMTMSTAQNTQHVIGRMHVITKKITEISVMKFFADSTNNNHKCAWGREQHPRVIHTHTHTNTNTNTHTHTHTQHYCVSY